MLYIALQDLVATTIDCRCYYHRPVHVPLLSRQKSLQIPKISLLFWKNNLAPIARSLFSPLNV